MAAWRRRALETFPELRQDLNDPDLTIYQLFFDLLPAVRSAHERRDEEDLRRIYDYAAWAFMVPEHMNAVAVSFYEHLLDGPVPEMKDVARRLSLTIIEAIWPLWEDRLDADRLAEAARIFRRGR